MPGRLESVKPGTFADLGIRTLSNIYDFAIEDYSASIAMKKRHSWGYQSISYQEFGKLISFLGSGLMSKGLGKGDRVALMAGNSPEWVVMYSAITARGAVVVPLDTNLRENELKHVLLHSMAKFLVVSPGIYHDLVKGTGFKDVDIIVLGEQDSTIEAMTVTEIMAAGKEIINSGDVAFFNAKAEVKPEDMAAICYTSGTTGNSKAAVLLHRNLVDNIE
jgi:long-chain acyl-CoA synthetase